MQLDMHYFGTYAMARAAGLSRDSSRVIATSAQFVDDNVDKDAVVLKDGARIDVEATAHHAVDKNNIDAEDQRKIWVPFHFIPGNQGQDYTERLVCQMDSDIARELVQRSISMGDVPYALELMGTTAHVYADTFSHYGFSGVSSRRNMVVNDSIEHDALDPELEQHIKEQAEKFTSKYGKEARGIMNIRHNAVKGQGVMATIASWFAETLVGGLGHGAVMTYPDRPYLKWSFEYEYPVRQRVQRDNPATFSQACQALHGMFRQFADRFPKYRGDDGKEFSAIADRVDGIIRTQAPCQGRIDAWQKAAAAGELFLKGGEMIDAYDADGQHSQRKGLVVLDDSRLVARFSIFRFYQAAASHRNYVLRELLPGHLLIVD